LLNSPYVAEIEFLKEVKNIDGKAKKKRFENEYITSPFFFFLKIKGIEDDGTLRVAFYKNSNKNRKYVEERSFSFGEKGKYYDFIIFFDQIKGLSPGIYRITVFLRDHLIYEGNVRVNKSVIKK